MSITNRSQTNIKTTLEKKTRREMMKVHREQKRQRYHQNVQSKSNKNDVNYQQNQYDEEKKKKTVNKVWK